MLDDESDNLISALNRSKLPERYSAIWHSDTNDLEIIFTTLRLGNHLSGVENRSFLYRHLGREYQCQYGDASDDLMEIASAILPIEQSVTGHRNLPVFMRYIHSDEEEDKQSFGKPICFWIKNIDWDEDNIYKMVSELNFYMTYYDTTSPVVMVHTPRLESLASQPQPRLRNGSFPKVINAHGLDDNLLRFWAAARTGDPASRFVYCFRIIEYAATMYLEKSAKSAVRRIVADPIALDNPDKLVQDLLSIIHGTGLEAVPRFDNLVRDLISPEALWREIFRNKSAFDRHVRFDGGFELEPIAKDVSNEKQFGNNGVVAFCRSIRNIRNALSHGQDQRSRLPITPTSHNQERLQPWAAVIAFAAGEVILYQTT